MNFDQTLLKYATIANRILWRKGTKHVAIKSQSYKNAITATFGMTFDQKFLPMQVIYRGKTEESIPQFKFPDFFSLNANEKHFSNTHESLKLIDEIITLYAEKQRKALNYWYFFGPNEPNKLCKGCKKKLTKVPHNMKNLFQPLDLTVNSSASLHEAVNPETSTS